MQKFQVTTSNEGKWSLFNCFMKIQLDLFSCNRKVMFHNFDKIWFCLSKGDYYVFYWKCRRTICLFSDQFAVLTDMFLPPLFCFIACLLESNLISTSCWISCDHKIVGVKDKCLRFWNRYHHESHFSWFFREIILSCYET